MNLSLLPIITTYKTLRLAFGINYSKAKRSNDEFVMTQLKAEYDKRNLQLQAELDEFSKNRQIELQG